MELVYLWVEDYKNIHKQGFNFSPRFECKFHAEYDEDGKLKDNCKLEIIEKKEDEYIKDFFGKNINATAIVGKNGSGKSSVLEIIKSLLDNNMQSGNDFIVLYANNEYLYYSSQEILKTKTIKWIGTSSDVINIITHSSTSLDTYLFMNRSLVLYDFINDMDYARYKGTPHNGGLNFEMIKLDMITYYSLSQNLILKYLLKKDNYIFNPDKFVLMIRDVYFVRKLSAIISYHSPRISHTFEEIHTNLEKYIKTYGFEEKIKLYIFLMQFQSNSETGTKIELILSNYINKKLPNKDELAEYINIEDALLDNVAKLKMGEYYNIKDMKKILLKILEHPITKNIFIDFYSILIYDSDLKKYFKDLSTGEKDFLLVLALVYENIEDTKFNIILLDEIEAFFHPSWSKSIMNILFQELQTDNHLIFTTHSPFLLSDIPKQNIIFLDTNEDGNCKVVDGLNEKKETFGANIHTLLSDSFFMDGGLMGEFAKGKIEEAIKYLNQEKLNEKELKYCEQIISIIGEPIVKNQLQRMLDSKRLKKVDEIDAIKQSMEAMQKRLDELEK